MVTTENADTAEITCRVQTHVSNVQIERETLKEIDYNLPSHHIDKFAGQYAKLIDNISQVF